MGFPVGFERFFNKLARLKNGNNPNRYYACCPSHDDDNPSLSILYDPAKDCVTFKCHAKFGCTREDVMRALGFTKANGEIDWSVLFAPKAPTKRRDWQPMKKQVASYSYKDESKRLLFQCVRFDPKEFKFRRPNENYDPKVKKGPQSQEWIWDLKSTRLVLFKTHWLIDIFQREPNRAVFVVEGEKNALALWEIGLVATCNPMGAGAWKPQYGDQLNGRNVVVIPDEDPPDVRTGERPGLEHAVAICADLAGKAKSIRLLRIPVQSDSKQDVYDWIDAQKRQGVPQDDIKGSLVELAKGAEKWRPELAESLRGANHHKALEAIRSMVLELLSQAHNHDQISKVEHGFGECAATWEKLGHNCTTRSINPERLLEMVGEHALSLTRLAAWLIELQKQERSSYPSNGRA